MLLAITAWLSGFCSSTPSIILSVFLNLFAKTFKIGISASGFLFASELKVSGVITEILQSSKALTVADLGS